MKSDFPLDHETIRDEDDAQGDDDGYFCYFSDSDDPDDPDDLEAGETQAKGVTVPFVMPALKLGPLVLSEDETKDKDFLGSVCMETTLEYIDYHFEERAGSGRQSACDIHFLRSIKYNLLYIALQYNLVGKDSYGKIKMDKVFASLSKRLHETNLEIERLRKHPTLFPSKDTEDAFDRDVKMIFSGALKYNGPEREEIREKEKQQLLKTVLQGSADASYAEQDPRRKPWQQYLHDRAPGAGLDQSVMRDGQSNQVMPHAALRILENWTVGYHHIYREIKQECDKKGVPFTIPQLELDLTPRTNADGNHRTFMPSTTYIDPVQAAPTRKPRAMGVSRLEDLNEDFTFLTQPTIDPEVANPNFRSLIVGDRPPRPSSR